jgi:hypothetical protein
LKPPVKRHYPIQLHPATRVTKHPCNGFCKNGTRIIWIPDHT